MKILRDSIRLLCKKPVTLKYPFERVEPPEGLRGRPIWDMEKCIGCGACERICPSAAIVMEGRRDEAVITHYVYRCMFCEQCVETCPKDAIHMSQEFELANFDKKNMYHVYEMPEKEEDEEETSS